MNQQQLNVGKDKYEVKKYNTQIYQLRGFEIFSITKKKYVNPPLRRLILTLTEYEILVQNVSILIDSNAAIIHLDLIPINLIIIENQIALSHE